MSKPYGIRFPDALAEIIDQRAQADGITPAEVIRNVVHAWAFGQPAGADEGYYLARGNAARISHYLVADAFARLPAGEEEARELLASLPPRGGRV